MNSISSLEKCIPIRGSSHMDWKVLERNNHAKRRKDNKRLLPLSILVKIKGPPKVLDPYKLQVSVPHEEDPNDSSASCTPLNLLPAQHGFQLTPIHDKKAMPVRPPMVQSKQIPGRYFPKPSPVDDNRLSSLSINDSDFKFRSETTMSSETVSDAQKKEIGKNFLMRSCDFNKAKAEATNAYNEKIMKSRKLLMNNVNNQKFNFNIGYRESLDPDSKSESRSETQSVRSLKRVFKSSRHVSVPRKNTFFVDILTGTTKTLHKKEERTESQNKSTPGTARNTMAHVMFEETNDALAAPIAI